MKRRGFLAGISTLPALAASIAAGATANRHAQWVADWRRSIAEWETVEEDSVEDRRLTAKRHELEERICTTPAANKREALAQISFYTDPAAGFDIGCAWKDLDHKLLASVTACLESAA